MLSAAISSTWHLSAARSQVKGHAGQLLGNANVHLGRLHPQISRGQLACAVSSARGRSASPVLERASATASGAEFNYDIFDRWWETDVWQAIPAQNETQPKHAGVLVARVAKADKLQQAGASLEMTRPQFSALFGSEISVQVDLLLEVNGRAVAAPDSKAITLSAPAGAISVALPAAFKKEADGKLFLGWCLERVGGTTGGNRLFALLANPPDAAAAAAPKARAKSRASSVAAKAGSPAPSRTSEQLLMSAPSAGRKAPARSRSRAGSVAAGVETANGKMTVQQKPDTKVTVNKNGLRMPSSVITHMFGESAGNAGWSQRVQFAVSGLPAAGGAVHQAELYAVHTAAGKTSGFFIKGLPEAVSKALDDRTSVSWSKQEAGAGGAPAITLNVQ